jgi:hypothetical protein
LQEFSFDFKEIGTLRTKTLIDRKNEEKVKKFGVKRPLPLSKYYIYIFRLLFKIKLILFF